MLWLKYDMDKQVTVLMALLRGNLACIYTKICIFVLWMGVLSFNKYTTQYLLSNKGVGLFMRVSVLSGDYGSSVYEVQY